MDIREKLLTRQIDAIHHQNRHRKTKLIDQMKFVPDNQENVLAHIRMLGKFNLDNFQTSDPFNVEDYICPNDDHDFMYKGLGLNGNPDINVNIPTVLDFTNNKALINENANNINDSIINITLNESRELIEESRELIERAKLFEFDEFLAEPENVTPIEEDEPAAPVVKRNSQKIKIHNCTGTINLKNISKLTINTNCRGTDKKDNLTFATSSSGTNLSTPIGNNDVNCATYNCEFYNRLISEIKNCIRRSDNSDMTSSTIKDSSSMKTNSALKPDSNSFDSHCKKILLKNIKNLKIQIPDGNDPLSGYLDANIITHPVQIEEWLKQIISETEIEPMQNVEILEHSIINTPSTPTSP